VALTAILTLPTHHLQAFIGDKSWKNSLYQIGKAVAAVGLVGGAGWKGITSYRKWNSAKLNSEAQNLILETKKKYKDIFDLFNQAQQESEAYKHKIFSDLILQAEPSDTHFSRILEHTQRAINQTEHYLAGLVHYKEYESTCATLTTLKNQLIQVKDVITRLNEYAQATDLITSIKNSFTQEAEILVNGESDKARKHAIQDLIKRSHANTDLKFVAYNQKLSRNLHDLHAALQFSIFNAYFRKDYTAYFDTLNRMMETLKHIQAIVHSSHYFQVEEEVQQLRTQIKALTRTIEEQRYQIQSQQNTISSLQLRVSNFQHALDQRESQLRAAYNKIDGLNNQLNRVNNQPYKQQHVNVQPTAPRDNQPAYNPEYYHQDGSAKEQQQSNNTPSYNPEFYDANGNPK
jgi:uncharacterized protein YdcH (DUF465 family)